MSRMTMNHRSQREVVTVLAGMCLTLVFSGAVFAADTVPQNLPDPGEQIETIVVTARHRLEKSQDVPVSMKVIDGQMQSELNLNSLNDLTQTEPSIHVGNSGRNSDMYIRGIGSGNNPSFDQSVGMFIDGIYHGRSRVSASTFLDLDRLELLKGPQSTFFGNSAIAGALNIVTRKPTTETDASVRAFYSPRAGKYTMEANGGGAITDTIAARGTLIVDGMKGWLENVNLGTDAPKEDNIAGRMSFLYKPSKDFNATLKIEASNNKSSGEQMQVDNCPPPPPFKAAGFCSAALSLGNFPVGMSGNRVSLNSGQEIKLDTREAVLTLNYNQSGYTFTSITGFYKYNFNLNLDIDATPLTLFTVQPPERYRQLSQEFRVASPINQPIEYLAGVYYQSDTLSLLQDMHFNFLSPIIKSAPPFAGLIPFLPLGQVISSTTKEDIASFFGAISWNATDRLKLTGELRGSQIKKDFNGSEYFGTATKDYGGTTTQLPASVLPLLNPLGLGLTHTLSASRTDDAWMPSAKIQYKLAPASMAYASYSRGIKAGGFNGVDTSGRADRLPFGTENVDAFEFGLKNKWDRVLLNVSLFRSDYTGLQVAKNFITPAGAFVSLVANAASAVSQGVELEGQWAVTPNFRLVAEATYLDAHYKNYQEATATQLQTLSGQKIQNLSGRPTQFAPEWSGTVTGSYKTRIANNYKMTTALSAHFSTSYFLTNPDDDTVKQGNYTRLDGRITLESHDGRWAFDLIGQNLTDKTILISGSSLVNSLGSVELMKQMPRSIGVQVRYRL